MWFLSIFWLCLRKFIKKVPKTLTIASRIVKFSTNFNERICLEHAEIYHDLHDKKLD